MRPLFLTTLFALGIAGLSSPLAAAGGTAEVRFVDTDSYTDPGDGPSERKDVMAALGRHLQDLARRKLGAGETL